MGISQVLFTFDEFRLSLEDDQGLPGTLFGMSPLIQPADFSDRLLDHFETVHALNQDSVDGS